MGIFSTPSQYTLFNNLTTKNVALVVKIDGVPDLLTSRPIFARVRYGDDILYGGGYVYGGLRPISGVRDILSLDGSSLSISQKIEPEKGKGSITIMSLGFIDKDQYMTRLFSPGVIVPEILGREIRVFLGYEEISYPEDYFQLFRGYVSGVTIQAGLATIQLSDPGLKKKQRLFFTAKTATTAPVDAVVTSIPVASTTDFHRQILGPNAAYDPAITTFIKVEDEIMQYGPAGIPGPTSFTVTRGARSTVAASHDTDADVSAIVVIQDHAIDMVLKLYMSGWGGYWKTAVPVISILKSTDPLLGDIPGALVLPQNIDAKAEYGLSDGDYVSITGGPNNGITGQIVRFQDLFDQPNRMIIIDQTVLLDEPSSATLSFRSQYDTYPVTCGLKLTPVDIDTDRHVFYQTTFLNQDENAYRFFLDAQVTGKDFIEDQVYLPIGAYSVTRNGRLSMGISRPPIADQTLVFLTEDNVLNPQNIAPLRALNNRKFFNEIRFEYDYTDAGKSTSVLRFLDTDSLNEIGVSTELPIISKGARTDLGIEPFFNRRADLLLSRFKRGTVQIKLKVNYQAANLIEAGDIVAIKDNATLQISNWATGQRDLQTQLYEVVDRTLNIKDGNGELMLIAGLGGQADDRYATISPSSQIVSGSTATEIIIQDSYGPAFVGDEQRKWTDYIGEKVFVHDEDYTVTEETTLLGFDTINRYKMLVSGLSFSPPAGYIVDIPYYPTDVDPSVNLIYKLIHCFTDPQVDVVTGVSAFAFTVSAGDIGKFFVTAAVRVHNDDFSIDSGDVKVTDVTGVTVTVGTTLGFTPSVGQRVDLIGFADSGGAYRYI